MATYTKTTDFLAKDYLPLNNAAKYVKGSEIDTEYNNIATADADNMKKSAMGTGVETFLRIPSSANLAAAVTDETGSGLLVFATSPTLTTPILGAATATSINGLNVTATTGTLTLSNGKTLTVSGTLTFAGTDGKTLTVSNSLALVGTDGKTLTLTDSLTVSNALTFAGTNGTTITFQATDTYVGRATTDTLTNKRVTARVGSTTSHATPTINTNNVDVYKLTAQTEAITSFTTNLSGTPTDAQVLIIQITGTASRAITWGASFEASTVALPTTTVSTNMLTVGFLYNSVTSKWRCVASA